jgi:3',5'-cyclic AMP phosphodiesterase CpdA
MKIAHFGDLHFVPADLKVSARGPGSLQHLVHAIRRALKQGISHLVISGDLLEGGYPAGYDRVRGELDRLGVFDPQRMSIVPGNHDLFFYPALLCGKPRRSIWQHMGFTLQQARHSSLLRLTTRNKRTKAFWKVFGDLVPSECRLRDGAPLPFVKPIADEMVLVGMDTTPYRLSRLPGRYHLQSVAGYASHEDWSAVEEALSSRWPNYRRVVLMHHYPFRGMPTGFRKAEYLRLWRFLRRVRPEAILCGHIHVSNGPAVRRGGVWIFCQGTSGGVHRRLPTYSLHDFSEPGRPRSELCCSGTLPAWWLRRPARRRFVRAVLPA